MIRDRQREALNEIIKLHPAEEGYDANEQLVPICGTCMASGEMHQSWPCPTVKIAHKAINPQINLGDIQKDALQRIRLDIKRREDSEWVKGPDKPDLQVVS